LWRRWACGGSQVWPPSSSPCGCRCWLRSPGWSCSPGAHASCVIGGLLLVLSIPIPAVLLGSLALPLQLEASRLGAWLLAARQVPVQLAGNVIQLPGHSLFVTEACSGLRSLTALIALGLLLGGLGLRTVWLRVLLVATAIPVALTLNACRIFGTGFLVYFVDGRFGDGFLHVTQGWALFVPAFVILATLARGLERLER